MLVDRNQNHRAEACSHGQVLKRLNFLLVDVEAEDGRPEWRCLVNDHEDEKWHERHTCLEAEEAELAHEAARHNPPELVVSVLQRVDLVDLHERKVDQEVKQITVEHEFEDMHTLPVQVLEEDGRDRSSDGLNVDEKHSFRPVVFAFNFHFLALRKQ